METVRRNRVKTTQRIVQALEAVITERGLQGVGVNRIAEEADVSKVLIYRYFGGVEGLIDHYVRMGKLFPVFSPEILAQIRPVEKSDLARVWYRQVLYLYRSFRTFKASREVLKATIIENDTLADAASKAVDEEMTRLVEQLSFVEGFDTKALSALILGGMSYLTILAQQNRPMLGLDLRDQDVWKRIEEAVKIVYIAINRMDVNSDEITLKGQPTNLTVKHWV